MDDMSIVPPNSSFAAPPPVPTPPGAANKAPLTGSYTDEEILELWKDIKRETIDDNWVMTRQYQRNIFYILGRQWITYQSRYGGWRDKRMASWIPRPVTNKCKETVQAIRAMFTSIKLSVNVRPNGAEPANVSAAATADELSPLLHEVHLMNQAMSEFDFWLIVCGNAFLHTYIDYDIKHGELVITGEQCLQCKQVYPSDELAGAQPICPDCGGTEFQQATDPMTGAPIETRKPKGIPATTVLSPLEVSFSQSYTRFDDLPYIVRNRWRTKRYYESHPVLKDLVSKIAWQKAPADHSLSLFTALAQTNDLGLTTNAWSEGAGRGGQSNEDGIAEYEVWMKPTSAYPEGLVFRIVDDKSPLVVQLEEEGLPGPLPYTDAEGNCLFTFAHATYEHVGGRILGSGALDVMIQKQDQLNQLDSQVLLCLQRMANPMWLWPKGCEIQKMTGMPGLVVKYSIDPLGPSAKPERIPGIPIDSSVMQLREQYISDIETLTGTYEILKGNKPAGVEAFSAIQALIERSQARFASVFTSRGEAYKQWFRFALELERAFGPEERTKAVETPARSWTFETFKRAQLQGAVTIIVEDGSTTPKTNLGMRASIEHAAGLGMLNLQDPDQQYEGLKAFGLTRMIPSLDINIQAALRKQEAFEVWVKEPSNVEAFVMQAQQQQMQYDQQVQAFGAQQQESSEQLEGATDPSQPMPAPSQAPPPAPPAMLTGTPLEWRPWYSAQIHMSEFNKWANGDHITELLATTPIVAKMLELHMADMSMALMPPPVMGAEAPPAQGAAKGMSNSNQNSAPAGNTPQPPQGV